MPSIAEIPLLLRQFRGVNIAQDSAFVDPSYLQRCTNWAPGRSFLLEKRRGAAVHIEPTAAAPLGIFRTYAANGDRLLYMVLAVPGGDVVYVNANDSNLHGPAITGAGGSTFTQSGSRYGFAVLGNAIYVGNGIDPVMRLVTGGPGAPTANERDLAPLALTDVTGATALAGNDTDSNLLTGSYAYCWAVYNTIAKLFTSRGPASSVVVSGKQHVTFTAPNGTGLVAGDQYRLFVAPVNLPVEFAYDQKADGFSASSTYIATDLTIGDIPIPTLNNIQRTGRFLLAHRDRIWMAGDQANKSLVAATSRIILGLEQLAQDVQPYFPTNAAFTTAKDDGDEITGMALAAVTVTNTSPSAPVIICKNNSTWAWFGDIVGDDNASLVQLSSRIGCIAHATMVQTPIGLIFCGHESVYLVRPDVLVPEDIGWTIAPAIRAIPRQRRAFAFARFDHGFYKLTFSPPGASLNTEEWWLDLRFGLASVPSWWGPHIVPGYLDATVGTRYSEQEDERVFAALNDPAVTPRIDILEQPGIYLDGGANIISVLRTKQIDAGKPFDRKLFTRFRVIGRAESETFALLAVVADGGTFMVEPDVAFRAPDAADWEIDDWEISDWAVTRATEGESIFNVDRVRCQAIEFVLTHTFAAPLDLRDFEVRYIPKDRPVADYPQDT